MGARSPANTRTRRGAFKCEFCGRNLLSAEGLKSHQRTLHSIALKDKEKKVTKVDLRSQTVASKVQKPKKGIILKKVSKVTPTVDVKKMPLEKEKKQNANTAEEILQPEQKATKKVKGCKSANERKVEFKCPKCQNLFPVFFSAQRHIQKYHCVNEKGEKVNPNSPDLIKPLLVEQCLQCNLKFTDTHDCLKTRTLVTMFSYECMNCQQKFTNMKMYHVHITGMHADGVENMFFRTKEEFNKWREEMETQTECKYLVMAKYSTKHIYCCSYTPDTKGDTTLICPSTVTYQEFSKGIQVHYYPNHSGHSSKPYILSNKYKSYTISDLIEQASIGEISDDGDLYLQFKTLMDNIVLDAAKINIDTLKVLINKAIDMTSILTHYDEDDDVVTTTNRSYLLLDTKKKVDGNGKNIAKAIENLGSKGMKRNTDGNDVSPPLPKQLRRSTFSLADEKDSDNILKVLDDQNVKIGKITKIQSPSSFNDSYKEFIDKSLNEQTDKRNNIRNRKKVVKTKMGQFKPSISPKKVEKRNSTGKLKDVEYEVRERDDDCNILVLKI